MVRYYGWYSNRMRGDRRKQEEKKKEEGEEIFASDDRAIDIRAYKPKRIPQLIWRECIKKVWEVDPLICPKCTGEMKIISFIYQRKVIKKILTHLTLYEKGATSGYRRLPNSNIPSRKLCLSTMAGWNTRRLCTTVKKVIHPSLEMYVQKHLQKG